MDKPKIVMQVNLDLTRPNILQEGLAAATQRCLDAVAGIRLVAIAGEP